MLFKNYLRRAVFVAALSAVIGTFAPAPAEAETYVLIDSIGE